MYIEIDFSFILSYSQSLLNVSKIRKSKQRKIASQLFSPLDENRNRRGYWKIV